MARISFSALVEEIVGKLAGSVFQDSYGGFQIRTRVSPRNPQTKYQQLRRGEFGFLSATWRTLTSIERQTFIDNAASPGAALNLFLQANVNLTLIEEPTITTYIPSSDPGDMQIEFQSVDTTQMMIKATGGTTVVPDGSKLLIQVTYQKAPTKIFTNPSQYGPVISFDEGTDLSIPTDILTEWQSRYGQLVADKRLCLKANLIDKSNGRRGADVVNCTITEEMNKFTRINSQVAPFTTAGTGVNDAYAFNIPANALTQDGDSVIYKIWGKRNTAGGTGTVSFFLGAGTTASNTTSSATDFEYEVRIVRVGADAIDGVMFGILNGFTAIVIHFTLSGLDFTNTINAKWQLQMTVGGDITLYAGYVNKELV
jgi:hypothetical protein